MQQKYKQKKEQRSVQILENSEKGLGLEQMSFEHLFESRDGGTFFQIDGYRLFHNMERTL